MELTEKITPRYSYYDILEVDPLCPQHEVTLAYERARLTYSGKNPAVYTIFSEVEAREMLRIIEEAYSVIGNQALRLLYDEKLNSGRASSEEVSHENLQKESKSRSIANQLPKRPRAFKLEYQKDEAREKEINEATNWNGETLRSVREYKKVSLDQLSEITKISSYYLNAVEEMKTEHLPAKVFVRGYVAQICRVLALNEKRVCDSYMQNLKPQT